MSETSAIRHGREFVMQLFMLLKTARVHELGNDAFEKPLSALMQTIDNLVALEGRVALRALEGNLYLNERRVKGDSMLKSAVEGLTGEFSARVVGGFSIVPPVSRNDVRRFVAILSTPEARVDKASRATLQSALEAAELHNIQLAPIQKLVAKDAPQEAAQAVDERQYALYTYAKAIVGVKRMLVERQGGRQAPDQLKVQRLVQDLVDICDEDSHFFLGLTTIKDHDDFLYNHSVNVSILSIAFGHRLGLSKKLLAQLGMAALLHDLGMTLLPLSLSDSSRVYTDSERRAMQSHPLLGVRALLGQGTVSTIAVRRMMVAYEHHLDFNLGGYPARRRERAPNLFSRIVQITDSFDAFTTQRPYREAYLPDEALKLMVRGAGTKYDPTLLKIFVNMVGVYPLGTFVELDSGELAIVYHNSNDPQRFERPLVKVVTDASGSRIGARLIDLADKNATGGFARSIVRSIDPMKHDINVASHILG